MIKKNSALEASIFVSPWKYRNNVQETRSDKVSRLNSHITDYHVFDKKVSISWPTDSARLRIIKYDQNPRNVIHSCLTSSHSPKQITSKGFSIVK